MSSLLSSLQADVEARLKLSTFFVPAAPGLPITVLSENLGDIENQIDAAIGGLGICAIVMTPSGEMKSGNLSKIFFDSVEVRVRIVELVVTNRATGGTLQPALLAAEAAAWALHHFAPPTSGGAVLVFNRIARVDSDSHLIYDAIFQTKAGLAAAPERVTS